MSDRTLTVYYVAQVRSAGARLWETLGRHRTPVSAGRRVATAVMLGRAHGRVLQVTTPSYYDPIVMLRVSR